MMVQERLRNLISMTEKTCEKWIKKSENGQIEFVDPIDKKEISAHYGSTHMAAALIICGHEKKGVELLNSILDRWNNSMALPGFHNDFNNFALCVIYNRVNEILKKRIRNIVLQTSDSNHDTVNWLPMRWNVNRNRYLWTKEEKYLEECKACSRKIATATWSDGFIDDRLPVGLSFNLQYDVATVAVMQFLRVQGEQIDITKELGALLAAELPDGDINYLGRGTNQIFAWGLWVYLLASSGQYAALERAVSFLEKHLLVMLEKQNLMLNDIQGKEKYMWWDYHYCSVYTAHFLMWMSLALEDFGKSKVVPKKYHVGNSGVKIYCNEFAFAVTFEGRREYLAERGPILCALWTKSQGMILKGTFGPWQGAFGNLHMESNLTLKNFAGVLEVKTNKDYSKNRLLNKLGLAGKECCYEIIKPQFCCLSVSMMENMVEVTYILPKKKNLLFNIPVLENGDIKKEKMHLIKDGKECELVNSQMLKNQYGWCKLFQSKRLSGKQLRLRIER